MATAIFTTQITYKYLMNKSKSDIADLTIWILDLKCKEQESFDNILTKVMQCLDDGNIQGAKYIIKKWDKDHLPFEGINP
jgi:hypothetical protein